MKKGIINTIIYYCVGLLVTALSYLIFDHSYAHGPSLYHVAALLTFFVGVFWTAGVVLKFVFRESSEERKGMILANLAVLIGTYLIFYFAIIRPYQTDTVREIPEDRLTTSINGDTATIDNNGQIIYLKVKDSVYLDFTDSTK